MLWYECVFVVYHVVNKLLELQSFPGKTLYSIGQVRPNLHLPHIIGILLHTQPVLDYMQDVWLHPLTQVGEAHACTLSTLMYSRGKKAQFGGKKNIVSVVQREASFGGVTGPKHLRVRG